MVSGRWVIAITMIAATRLGAQSAGAQGGVPEAYRPPPGMCRIWIEGVPPERQPAPTDCATAVRRRPANAHVVFGDLSGANDPPANANTTSPGAPPPAGTTQPAPAPPPAPAAKQPPRTDPKTEPKTEPSHNPAFAPRSPPHPRPVPQGAPGSSTPATHAPSAHPGGSKPAPPGKPPFNQGHRGR